MLIKSVKFVPSHTTHPTGENYLGEYMDYSQNITVPERMEYACGYIESGDSTSLPVGTPIFLHWITGVQKTTAWHVETLSSGDTPCNISVKLGDFTLNRITVKNGEVALK